MPQPPPEPTRLELPPVRVTHAGWVAPTPAPLAGRNARRGLTREILQPILVSTNDPVRACYKGLLAFSPQAAGTISVLMHVGPEGNVIDVETVGTPDASLSIMLPCVLNSVRSRRFPVTRGHTVASWAFQFQASELAQANGPPVLSNATPRPNEIQVPNPDVTSLTDTCFAAALTVMPDVAGQFTLRLAVEPSGSVARAEVSGQILGPLHDCIAVLGRQLRFHPAVNGADISIPVTLAREDAAAPATPAAPADPTATPATAAHP